MRKHAKISQLYGQIFTYMLTLLLIAFILVYGYSSIRNILNKSDDVVLHKFQNDLRNSISLIEGDYGTVAKREFQLSKKITMVCFVENFKSQVLPPGTHPIIQDSVNSGTGNNVFTVAEDLLHPYTVGRISVEPDVLCIKTTGNKLVLRLEGKGDHVLLSEWEN